MSKQKTNICPCCPKGCDLSAPRCSRGEEYLRTGTISEKGGQSHHHEAQHEEEHHHGGHCCGGHHHEDHHSNYEKMNIDEKLFTLLNRLGRAGHGPSNGKSSQNHILRILSKSEHMTQRELTAQLGIQPGSASEIIKKLEAAGLITRQSNNEDRRTVDIALTDAGRARVAENSIQSEHLLFDALSEEEKQQLLSLLEKLGQHWHSHFRSEGRGGCKHGRKDCGHMHAHGCKHDNEHEHHHPSKHVRDPEHRHTPSK